MKHPADEIEFGNPTVEIKSCLIHPETEATKKMRYEHPDWSGVRYGLCQHCWDTLEGNKSYQKYIDDIVIERLTKLKKEREK